MKYQRFLFKSYKFDHSSKKLSLHYGIDDVLTFEEIYCFNFDFVSELDSELLDFGFRTLFFMAGISYYKTYLPPAIEIEQGGLTPSEAAFFERTWQNGLGEFFYVNNLDPDTKIHFPSTGSQTATLVPNSQGLLVAIGGGKDSLVSTEILESDRPNTWSLGHMSQLQPLVERIGSQHFWVERQWDRQLLELNKQGAYNGHIPISAIFACVGLIVAILSGTKDVVMSNESSASEPNLHYKGRAINHQYSKSLVFEQDFQSYLQERLGDGIRYFSLLRPLSELHIAELFVRAGSFDTYREVFSSCNRAFTHDQDHIFWCGTCPKCAFAFLIFTPFIERKRLEELFHGKNLLLDESLVQTYRELLGIAGSKPLDCVGEIKESRAAMRLAQNVYPELSKYEFELPENYDYKALAEHSMPAEVFEKLKLYITRNAS